MAHVAHQICLPDGSLTLPHSEGHSERVRRHTQLVLDLVGPQARVLDLACLEGGFTFELSLQGLDAIGVEGRAANIDKCSQVLQKFALHNCRFFHRDVRNLSAAALGSFDVVLCLGILYHLTADDAWRLVKLVYELCDRAVIIDTHVALFPETHAILEGERYHGRTFVEFPAGATGEQKQSMLLSSLDNPTSFWFTGPSLLRLLRAAGFTSVLKAQVPPVPLDAADRVTLVAFKGQPVSLKSCEAPWQQEMPERPLKRVLQATYSEAKVVESCILPGQPEEMEGPLGEIRKLRQESAMQQDQIEHLTSRLQRYLDFPLIRWARMLRQRSSAFAAYVSMGLSHHLPGRLR